MARLQADVPKDRADCARRPYGRPQTFDALSRTHAHPLRSEASRHPRHRRVDEQADQLFAMTDPMAERIRKVGGQTPRSIGHIARTQRVSDNDADYVTPNDMLAELRDDNGTLAANLRATHDLCNDTAALPATGCRKSGSMKPNGAPGSCLSPPAPQPK